jgi:hypothetical protein
LVQAVARITAMKLQKSDIFILILGVSICIILYDRIVPRDYFGYDEADHMFAVSQGFYTNYTDGNTISFLTFLKLGLQLGLQEENISSLSEFIRSSHDITFYRHYHGPLYFYGLIISRYFIGDDEYLARWTSLLFLIASIIAIYIGCLALSQQNARVAAVIASAMLICSSSNITTAAEISAHSLYTLTSIVALFFMAKLLQTDALRYWYYAIVAIALSFAVIEYAPILLVTFIVCALVQHKRLCLNGSTQNYKKLFAISVILFTGVIFIVWPASWLKLSLVKNYMFFIYQIFAREGQFGTQASWEIWWRRLLSSPFEYILAIPLMFIALINLKRYIFYLPFLIYSILMIIITFRNTSSSPTYISSLMPPLYIISGLVLAESTKYSKTLVKVGLSTVVIVVIFAHMCYYFVPYRSEEESYTPLKDLVNYVRLNRLEDKEVLIDRRVLPTLHYYFPHKYFPSYRDKVGSSKSIRQALQNASYDGVLYAGRDHHEFEKLLRQWFSVEPEIITSHAVLDRKITYFRIAAVQR